MLISGQVLEGSVVDVGASTTEGLVLTHRPDHEGSMDVDCNNALHEQSSADVGSVWLDNEVGVLAKARATGPCGFDTACGDSMVVEIDPVQGM